MPFQSFWLWSGLVKPSNLKSPSLVPLESKNNSVPGAAKISPSLVNVEVYVKILSLPLGVFSFTISPFNQASNIFALIIGAGPVGIACGIEAKKKNLKYTIIDKGCLVNSLYNYPLNMTFFSTSDRLEIGGVPFISNNSKPTRLAALEYYRRVCSHWKLNINLYEEVLSVSKEKKFIFHSFLEFQ